MPFQESPQQRESRENRMSFFGAPPMMGPKLPEAPSKIRESQRQIERREAKDRFFEPKVLKKSQTKEAAKDSQLTQPETKVMERMSGKTKNEATGGTLVVKDCEGTELFRIPKLAISGEQELRAGCDDSSSGSIGS